uniref:Uncharacterized protein n=1 Tax=Anguilla anguilla TaxID=7936 RepID=A0A0E9TY61_ANGAN
MKEYAVGVVPDMKAIERRLAVTLHCR